MRVYQLKHYEVLLNDLRSKEQDLLSHYEQLCRRILTSEAIAFSNAVEVAKITSFPKIERKPIRLQRLMDMRKFPPFHFVIAKN
ncbi:hypothetical protein HHL16_06875 [Pseudoflavitalea sp. G-6-1-2]|uniref:hypothetical protein n=1 Tax=Pseudoflavitalea sp. G-6-1-2 TaxID=2728841 RepID=UPI00146F82B3|nr:hypothetical protein [Pseudoflavitalea sp. G-6-1-2]NML20589.1 hypothetical protein [Pseudoflavitalea sp. G-6-1-2]